MRFCPIDEETLNYLATTGRTPELIHKVAAYTKANHLFYDATEIPDYTKTVTIDLAKIQPALAGPKRPQDRILLPEVGTDFDRSLTADIGPKGFGLSEKEWQKSSQVNWPNEPSETLQTGDIVLAAITSCTNTSNPFVMLSAGLLAKGGRKRIDRAKIGQDFLGPWFPDRNHLFDCQWIIALS